MVSSIQPLVNNQPIVHANGNPTEYFIRWAQQRQIDITGSITYGQAEELIQQYLADLEIQAGNGIDLTPSGDIVDSPIISANVQAILNQITTTRGSILYRGATNWQALAPGSSGQFLRTNGSGNDPSWAAAGGGGYQRLIYSNPEMVVSSTGTATQVLDSFIIPGGTLATTGDFLLVESAFNSGSSGSTRTAILRMANSGGTVGSWSESNTTSNFSRMFRHRIFRTGDTTLRYEARTSGGVDTSVVNGTAFGRIISSTHTHDWSTDLILSWEGSNSASTSDGIRSALRTVELVKL